MTRGDLLDVTPESYDRCLDINTRGTFFLTQAFARRLLARERPADAPPLIVTVSSANAVAPVDRRGEYCISKAGASMMSKLFAARLSNDGIGVYEIQPGFIETEMTAPSKAQIRPADRRRAHRHQALRHAGGSRRASRLTLASGLLPYTSGQIIQADGGLLAVRY